MNDLWNNDKIQFIRLLAEIHALGLCHEDKNVLCSSMDISRTQLEELFQRAENQWEELKADYINSKNSPVVNILTQRFW